MKRSTAAFTLIEMLMVMVIIAVLTALIAGVAGAATRNSMKGRAKGEIDSIAAACEHYKTDFGGYPRSPGVTEPDANGGGQYPDPRINGDPTTTLYQKASLYLYQQLSGDTDADGIPGDPDTTTNLKNTVYYEFKPAMLGGITATKPIGTAKAVIYLKDPYGFSYGYSTVGAYYEADYQQNLSDPTLTNVQRKQGKGYNPTFDLWSTTNVTIDQPSDLTRQKWSKNW